MDKLKLKMGTGSRGVRFSHCGGVLELEEHCARHDFDCESAGDTLTTALIPQCRRTATALVVQVESG